MSKDGQREGGVDRDEKYVSNIRSIRSVPDAKSPPPRGSKENVKERKKSNGVRWLSGCYAG